MPNTKSYSSPFFWIKKCLACMLVCLIQNHLQTEVKEGKGAQVFLSFWRMQVASLFSELRADTWKLQEMKTLLNNECSKGSMSWMPIKTTHTQNRNALFKNACITQMWPTKSLLKHRMTVYRSERQRHLYHRLHWTCKVKEVKKHLQKSKSVSKNT